MKNLIIVFRFEYRKGHRFNYRFIPHYIHTDFLMYQGETLLQ